MSALLAAAKAVVARWDSPKWKDEPATAVFIGALREAIEKEEQKPKSFRRLYETNAAGVEAARVDLASEKARQVAGTNAVAVEGLLEQWEKRGKESLPADVMLINKHIRELRAMFSEAPQPPPCGGYQPSRAGRIESPKPPPKRP